MLDQELLNDKHWTKVIKFNSKNQTLPKINATLNKWTETLICNLYYKASKF